MNGWESKPELWEEEPDNIKKQLDLLITQSEKTQVVDQRYDNIHLDAIFVLAGGLQNDGQVHQWVVARLDTAYQIYAAKVQKPKIICLGGGTYHKPPIRNDRDYVVHEATACAEYLIKKGVNPGDIYKEWASYDTVASAFFAYMNFIIPLKLSSFLIITSEFHMPRSSAIFNWILTMDDNMYNVFYLTVSDKGMDSDILSTRKDRETSSLLHLQNNVISKIRSLKQLHCWFYEDHKAYCSVSELIRIEDTTKEEKNSY
jgi:vancomycin permeability regulator SanA